MQKSLWKIVFLPNCHRKRLSRFFTEELTLYWFVSIKCEQCEKSNKRNPYESCNLVIRDEKFWFFLSFGVFFLFVKNSNPDVPTAECHNVLGIFAREEILKKNKKNKKNWCFGLIEQLHQHTYFHEHIWLMYSDSSTNIHIYIYIYICIYMYTHTH